MASSGSSGRHNSGSKAFDFGTDDILCSYEDYANQDNSNGTQSDPAKVLFYLFCSNLYIFFKDESAFFLSDYF